MLDQLLESMEQETKCGWVITQQQKAIWNTELALAKKLIEICNKHNLKCIAGFGTLLGAIRHNGFIPWDDDMDFLMPRSDYKKLCGLSKEFCEPFFLQTTETENGKWFRGYARLRYSDSTCITPLDERNYACNNGIFIDISVFFIIVDSSAVAAQGITKEGKIVNQGRQFSVGPSGGR